MTSPSSPRLAPGSPGIEPRWTRGAKVAVGTAYSTSSHVWYTLDCGCVTEVYYPTIDTPQIRDLQFLVTDGETFFHDERRNCVGEIACIAEAALGFEVINREKEGRYSIRKTVLGDPHQNCLLVRTRLEAPADLLVINFPTAGHSLSCEQDRRLRRVSDEGQSTTKRVEWGTTYRELIALRTWGQAPPCPVVAMESTGVSWKPV